MGSTTKAWSIFSFLMLCIVGTLSHSDHKLLLIVSFDGFRFDYLTRAREHGRNISNFQSLIDDGVQADHVKNAFITKTFPDHTTIATGLYEENHGIVANYFHDPSINETFINSDPKIADKPNWWNNGTDDFKGSPIWMTNEREKFALYPKRSGVFFWPGSSAENQRPFHYMKYDAQVKFHDRVDTVVEWFENDDEPINFGMLYYHEPDRTGHQHGPNSVEVLDMVEMVDGFVGYLINKLKKANLFNRMNIIITSDHGMETVKTYLYMDEYVRPDTYKLYANSPIMLIQPKPGFHDEVFANLSRMENVKVWEKAHIPRRYRYTFNRRITSIVLVAHAQYGVCAHKKNCNERVGDHGYNNTLNTMHPLFVAHGPAFKKNFKPQELHAVDIYSLMCHILDVEPAQHDGDFDRINYILHVEDNALLTLITCKLGVCGDKSSKPKQFISSWQIQVMVAVGFAALVSGLFCVMACRVRGKRKAKILYHVPLTMTTNGKKDDISHLLSSDEEEIP